MGDYSSFGYADNIARPASGGEPLNLVVKGIEEHAGDVLASSEIYRGD